MTATVRAPLLSAIRSASSVGRLLMITGIWLLARPYVGVVHDARIYLGRVLADMDPAGLGRDLMYVHDGQSGFSIFGWLLRPAVEHWGVGPAMYAISGVGILFWLAGAVALLSRFLSGRALWAGLVGVALIAGEYGGHGVFTVGEPFATPRVLAEAAAMFALALVLDRRWVGGALLLGLAGALHPILALPVAAVWLVMLTTENRRWLALPLIAGVVTVAAAVLGVPPANRLFAPIDREWLSVLHARSPYLFPLLWLPKDMVLFLFQSTVAGLAATIGPPRLRLVLFASLVVAAAGLAVAAAAPTLLIVQVQTWRAQWLLAVVAAGVFPWLIAKLVTIDLRGSATAAFLLAACLLLEQPFLAGAACGCALGVRFLQRAPGSALVRTAAWTVAACALAGILVFHGALAWMIAVSPTHPLQALRPSAAALVVAVLLPLSIAWLRWGAPGRLAQNGAIPLAIGAAVFMLSVLQWDQRTDLKRAGEEGRGARILQQHLPRGEVFWLGGDLTDYLWAMRPQWWSLLQGAPTVFDRDLAIEWGRRRAVLVEAGVEPPRMRFGEKLEERTGDLGRRAMEVICTDKAAPRVIVTNVARVAPSLRSSAHVTWSPQANLPRGADPADQMFLVLRCDPFGSYRP